jgi:hypothetical protein
MVRKKREVYPKSFLTHPISTPAITICSEGDHARLELILTDHNELSFFSIKMKKDYLM